MPSWQGAQLKTLPDLEKEGVVGHCNDAALDTKDNSQDEGV